VARLVTSGFETRDLGGNLAGVEIPAPLSATTGYTGSITASTATFDTATVRSGGANGVSLKCNTGAGAVNAFGQWTIPPPVSVTIFIRAYMYFSNLPTTTGPVIHVSNGVVDARLTSGGKLQLFFNGSQVGSDSAATITTGQWYRIEVSATWNGSAQITASELRLDGTTVASNSGQAQAASGNIATNIGFEGTMGSNIVCYVDDVAINDSSGANQNSFPGEGNVVLLLPTSDNSRGSWTGGAGGTTNLFDAINNTPPIGTASETNLTQIENTVSGATTPNGDFNMTTYAAAGIGASDVINCLTMIIAHGEDVATGTKTGTFKIVSNPDSGTADNIGQGNTQQFGPSAGGALGTYPTGWVAQMGAPVYNPSVTVGTAPVARITKTDTGTRVASACFMGIYVDYTPAPPATEAPFPFVGGGYYG